MAGKIIGLIPKSFIIVLIENHWWYNESKIARQEEVTSFYVSALRRSMSRQDSLASPRKDADYTDIADIVEDIDKEEKEKQKKKRAESPRAKTTKYN